MSFAAYVICATPRSGSTLLCDLLTASGVAGQPQSYLRSEDIRYYAELWEIGAPTTAADPVFNLAYLSAMIRQGTADTGIFGLRLMWENVGEATERLRAALGGTIDLAALFGQALGPTLFIHLSRRDKTAQAISLVRAEQTGLWHVATDGSERERTAPAQPPVFDAGRISKTRLRLESDDARWSSFFDQCGIRPLRISYEEVAAYPQEVLAQFLAALGRDRSSAASISVQTAKMADAMSLEWSRQVRSRGS